jgi:hypothetical protein
MYFVSHIWPNLGLYQHPMVSLIHLRVPKRRYHIPRADAFILSSLTVMPTKSPSTSTSFLCYTLLRWVYTVGGTPTSAYIYSPVLLNSLLLTFGHHFPYAMCSWLRLLQRIVGDLNLCAMVWDPLSTFICSFFPLGIATVHRRSYWSYSYLCRKHLPYLISLPSFVAWLYGEGSRT